jgi:16S rRNA (guanine527-N7)-methyltransferase
MLMLWLDRGPLMSAESLIAEGLDYFSIPHTVVTVEKLTFFIHELEHWNKYVNLTAKRPIEWIVRELLYDAFFLCSIIRGTPSALDVGSGSGVLAIPMAILDETMQVSSVDRTLKKIQFQRHVRRSLGLNNLSLIHGRIESLEPLRVDALLVKGFGPTRLILREGGRHLNETGVVYLLKGRTERGDAYPGFSLERATQYRLPGNSKEYQLFVYKKVS